MIFGRCWNAWAPRPRGAVIGIFPGADLDFHLTLVASGGNGRLVDAYAILSAQTLACINRLEIALPSGEEIIAEHAILIDAIAAGERDKLLKAINDHLSVAASHLTTPPAKTENSRQPD